MLDAHEERRLAQGLREGKTAAWQALYDAHAGTVWRTVARLLGPRATDVADVVQETMLAAAGSARSFDDRRGSLGLWLTGIARNHAILHLRRQDRRRRLMQAAATRNGQADRAAPSPAGALVTAELAEQVRATLAELPADYAVLLAARYLDGETVTQIAGREGASEVAVRSRLARARLAFRTAFGPQFFDTANPSTEK